MSERSTSEFIDLRQLADGPRGPVHLQERISDGQLVVAKCIYTAHPLELYRTLVAHGQALTALRDERIMVPESVLLAKDSVVWVTLHASRGNIGGHLSGADPWGMLDWLESLLDVVACLHRGGRWHGALKPNNVLLQLVEVGEVALRLSDVGLEACCTAWSAETSKWGAATTEQLASDVRAVAWLAYELLTGDPQLDWSQPLPETAPGYLIPRADVDVTEKLIDSVMAAIRSPADWSAQALCEALSMARAGPPTMQPIDSLPPFSLRTRTSLSPAPRDEGLRLLRELASFEHRLEQISEHEEFLKQSPRMVRRLLRGSSAALLGRRHVEVVALASSGLPMPLDAEVMSSTLEQEVHKTQFWDKAQFDERYELTQEWLISVRLGCRDPLALVVAGTMPQLARAQTLLEPMRVVAALLTGVYRRISHKRSLSDNRSWLQALLQLSDEGLLLLTHEGTVQQLNERAARWLGSTADSAVGQPLAQVAGSQQLTKHIMRGDGNANGELIGLPGTRVRARIVTCTGGNIVALREVRATRQRPTLSTRYTTNDLRGSSSQMDAARRDTRLAAESDASVLIVGESGTGKEVAAQAIHSASRRASGPFVGVNVAAIPHELLESELFGYEPGAFTGARAKGLPGKFEIAQGGTLLLDEIGDMPLPLQAKLLRVLEERSLHRLGSTRPVAIDCRIIATTHRDLEDAVEHGRFRLDLYHRLVVIRMRMPPLLDRLDDLPELINSFAQRFADREGTQPVRVSDAVLEQLRSYHWPGNVRELANLVEGWTCLYARGDGEVRTAPAHIRSAIEKARNGPASQSQQPPDISSAHPVRPLKEIERDAFSHALKHFNGNVKRAAEALGISRGTFYNKLARYKLGTTGHSS